MTTEPLGLRPRPQPEPDILAMLAAAVDQAWPRPVVAPTGGEGQAQHLRWRFSGRWWAQPTVARRDRPWMVGPTGG